MDRGRFQIAELQHLDAARLRAVELPLDAALPHGSRIDALYQWGDDLRQSDIIGYKRFDFAAGRPYPPPERALNDMLRQLERYRAFQSANGLSGRIVYRFSQPPPDWLRGPLEAGGAVIKVAG